MYILYIMAFKASPSSQHQHCTDEAQKAETVLSAVIYFIYIYIYIYIYDEAQKAETVLSAVRYCYFAIYIYIYIYIYISKHTSFMSHQRTITPHKLT